MKLPVADVRRLTLHDGPGTRTTVFVKGCPLRCLWCHNPESLSAAPVLLFHDNLCSGCGRCAAVCPQGVHSFVESQHLPSPISHLPSPISAPLPPQGVPFAHALGRERCRDRR